MNKTTTTTAEVRDALYSAWTPANGATLTLRKGRHTREARLYASNRHDLWLFKAMNARGDKNLAARLDLRQPMPDHIFDGWVIVE